MKSQIVFRLDRPGINLTKPERVLFLLWLFLLVFPKGGIKVMDIPITWGYLLLGLSFMYAITQKSWTIGAPRIEALLCLLPFQAISAMTIVCNSYSGLGWVISFAITFFFLPLMFFFIFSKAIETLDLRNFFELIKKGIALISYYGILHFFGKLVFGKYIEIPFLSVNLGDMGTLDSVKYNSRGIVSKLISTYNNGLIFGISLSILLPLYCYIQNNRWHRLATKTALFLTLSRTVWIALVFNELVYNAFIEPNRKKALQKILLALGCVVVAIGLLGVVWGLGFQFFMDGNFGGRRDQFSILQNLSFFSDKPFGAFPEIVYLGILWHFGIVGLLAYFLALGGPILFYALKDRSKVRLAMALGMLDYLFISCSDGAPLYIPVLTFYWFLASLMARKNLDQSLSAETSLPPRASSS